MDRAARFVAFASLLVCCLLTPQGVGHAQVSNTNTWSSAGQMTQARTGAAAVLLTNGQILITGGTNSSGVPQATVEIYNPATQAFTAVPAMNVPRANHAAIVLVTGDVLVTGGSTTGGSDSDSAEIFSVSTQQWTLLNSSIGTGLAGHTMATLSDGNILIAGGTSTAQVVGSIVLYNFTSQTFTLIASLLTARTGAVAAATPDGRVLIAGGTDINGAVLASTEIFTYSPITQTGTVSAGPTMSSPRVGATATSTYDGVAVIGGNNGKNDLGTAEIFSQWTNTFEVVSGGVPRSDHFAALLPRNGSILAAGGTGGTAVDLLQPWANNTAGAFFAVSPSLLNLDGGFASPAGLGSLLAAGGTGSSASAAELYAFPTISTDRAEYPPGTPVLMSGAGFEPFEDVTLHIHEWVKQTTEDDPDGSATADSFGNFSYDKYAPDSNDVGARYHLTAVGLSSGYQAQTIFGDSINGISFTNAPLDQPAGPGTINANACGEITLSVTQTGGTYGTIYLYDSDTGGISGGFYATQGACTSNGSTITSISAATISANPTDVTVWYQNPTAGSYSVYADSASGIPLIECLLGAVCSNQTEFIFAAPTKLSFSVQPGGGGPGAVWLQQPAVVVQDKNGNTVTSSSAPITLAITTTPPGAATGGTLAGCTTAVTAISGAASFSGCSITPANTACYYLSASSPGLTSATSSCFFIADAASAPPSTVTASPPPVAANGTATYTVTVTLEDSSSVALGGKSVTLTAGSGNATISGNGFGTSNGSGVATFTVTDTIAQSVTLTATDTTDGVVIGSVTVTFTAGAVSKTVSTATASPTSVLANGIATSTITVTLTDASGNPVSGKAVTLAATSCTTACTPTTGSSVITVVSGTTNSSGQATFTVTDTVVQTVTYTATDSTDTLALTSTKPAVVFTSTAPALAFTTAPPSSAANGSTFPVAAATSNTPADTGAITYTATGGCSIALVSGVETVSMTSGTTSCVVTAKVAAETTPNTYAAGSISATVTATPATTGSQNVVVTCTNVVYTGQPQTPCTAVVTLVNDPSPTESLTVVYTLQNTNVGTVTATATFPGDANNSPASNSTTFQITQAPSTVTVSCPASVEYVYTGSAQLPCTATVTGAGGLNQPLTPNYTNNVNAGTATASASYSDSNHSTGSGSSTFTIAPATSTVTVSCSPGSFTYTGSPLTPCTATVTGANLNQSLTSSITYTNNTNAGSLATASVGYNGGPNGDYTVSNGSGTFTITQASSATVTITCPPSVFYNGGPQTPCTASITPVGEAKQSLAVVYTPQNTNIGTVTATATYPGDTDNAPASNSSGFTINVAPIMATAGGFTGFYNSTAETISPCVVTGIYTGGLTCTNSVTSVGPGIGSGTVTPTVNGSGQSNFAITSVNGSWTISPAPVTATAGSFTGVYNGSTGVPSACVVIGTYTGTLSCTDNPTTVGPAAGTGTITPTVSGDTLTNYAITSVNGSYTISPAQPTVSVVCSPTSVVYNGAAQTPCTASVTGVNGLSQVLTPTYTNNIAVGTATATGTYTATTNYSAATNSANFAITAAAVTATAGSLNSPYSGSAQSPSACVVSGTYTGTLTCTDNPSSVGPNVGSGTVTPTVSGSAQADFTVTPVNGSWAITQASTFINLVCPPSVTFTGSALTPCTATVTGPGGLSQTLTVTYLNNTAVGQATASASYAGTTNYFGAGTSTNFTITQGTGIATTTTVTCPPSPVVYNGTAQTPCTASVSGSGGFTQSLTVTYTNNTSAGTATANAGFAGNSTYAGSSGTASFTVSPAPVTATAGSLNSPFNGSTQSPSACAVTGAFTGTLTCTDNPTSVGPAVGSGTVTPVVSGGTLTNFNITAVNGSWAITAATLTSTTTTVTCPASVVYSGSAQSPCTAVVTGSGGLNQALAVTYTNNTNAGTATASASYAGNSTYATSSNSANFTISQAPVTATAGSLNAAANGSAQSPSACVVSGAYTGSLSCTDNPSSVGPAVGSGTVTPTVSGSGQGNFAITLVNGSWTITAGSLTSTVTTVSCPASVVYDGSAQSPCTATVTGSGGLNQSVTVTYTSNTNVGSVTATASYAGTSTYAASSNAASFNISQAPVTATAGSLNAVFNGSAQSPSACVVSGAYTGGLTCTDNPASVGPAAGTGTVTPTVNGSGQANFAITSVNGSWTITTGTGTVSPTTTTVSCPASVVYTGSALTPCTATVTGAGGLSQSLTVTYTSNTNAGTATASASYPGDANYAASSNSANFTITQEGTSTTLKANSSSVGPGQPVTLTAQVTPATSGTPTGTVAFYDGSSLLGTQPLTSGTATLTTSLLTNGVINTLNAVYSGDTNFTGSQSSTTVSVGVLDFTLVVTGPASATVYPGGVATYQVIASPLNGSYPGPVSFTASGLPTGATIAFNPPTIAANGGQQTVTITINTPAVAKQESPSIGRRLAPLTLALLLFPLLGVGRLRRQGRRLSRLASLLLLLGCTLAGALMTGCSSPGSGFFTQAVQSYTIDVTATSGNVQHTAAVTLVVE